MTLSLLLAVSAFVGAVEGPGKAKELSREQAKAVVLAFLKSRGYRTESPKFSLENGPEEATLPDFYLFEGYYETPTRLTTIGFYAVNRKTVALWERVGCKEIKAKAVERLQSSLRRELGVSGSVHNEDWAAGPCY